MLLTAAAFLALVLATFLMPAKFPIALIQVVDAAGRPVAGVTVTPEALRARGPYSAGWYPWETPERKAPNQPQMTDAEGFARVPYPIYVLERLETGVIILSISHPDFVAQEIELPVAPALPLGGPIPAWITYFKERFSPRAAGSAPKPIVLVKGAILRIAARPNPAGPSGGVLRAILSVAGSSESDFWTNPERGVLMTHRLPAGTHMFQAAQIDAKGAPWFSDVKTVFAVEGQTNDLTLDLKRGVTLSGRLDSTVPRPVKTGRLIANVSPVGAAFSADPPQWHAWTPIGEDGSFEIHGLPPGSLEVIALCDGYVSTNGPGKYHFHYPQKYVLGTNDVSITVGMERTAWLEVRVFDVDEHPLKDATVSLWPNARYGEWSAVILGCDCYNTADSLLPNSPPRAFRGWASSFTAKTDGSGVARIPNLPVEASEFSVEHPEWALPPVADAIGQKRREQTITLIRGETNHATVKLERRHDSVILQY